MPASFPPRYPSGQISDWKHHANFQNDRDKRYDNSSDRTISYGDGLWLVPHWIVTGDRPCLTPDRIVRIDVLSLRKRKPPQPRDYHLLDCVPNSLLNGPLTVSDARQFVVIDRPKHIIQNICIESSHG